MKKLMMLSACLSIFLLFTACKKTCDTAELNPVCQETVPTEELCLAVFNGWFFDVETQSCAEIGYSGCSQKGFETKEDCETCKCN